MKSTGSRIKIVVSVYVLLICATGAMASKLDFNVDAVNYDGFGSGANPQYGDRIAGAGTENVNMISGLVSATYAAPGPEGATPDIAVDWGGDTKIYWATAGTYGDLVDVVYSEAAIGLGYLMNFVPDADYKVKIQSVKVGTAVGQGDEPTNFQITLQETSGWTTVWSSGTLTIDTDNSHYDLTVDYTGAAGQELWMTIQNMGYGEPNSWEMTYNVCVDDVVFSQAEICTEYLPSDISGPTPGVPDCYVDIHDFAYLALNWLKCTDPTNGDCIDAL